MANKRASGEGTIYKISSGKWRAQFSGSLGNRISFVGQTQAECQKWLTITKIEHLEGINILGGQQRLKDFIANWLVSIRESRSRSTVISYEQTLRPVHKYLGGMSINKIRTDHIQTMYNKLLASGSSAYTVKQIHKVLHSAFAFAKKLRVIARNPVSDSTPPKHKTKKMTCYDATQVQALLFGAQIRKDQYHPLYYLAINTGLRQAELLGLKWRDVDWTKSELSIERQLARYPGGEYEFSPPKSESGIRKISVGPDVLELLRSHLDNQEIKRAQKDKGWNKHKLIFPSTTGTPINASNLRRAFKGLQKFTGLPRIRFHDLRHTAATLMLNYGTPIPVVSQRLGHAKVSITMDIYAHAIPSKQTEAAELMRELMTPGTIPVAHRLHTKDE